MSHTVKQKAGIHDVEGLKRAVDRIPGAEYLGEGEARQYSGKHKGHIVKLPGYKYPVAIDLEAGTIAADTYSGSWGDPKLQDQLGQGYAVECGKMEAEAKGHKFEEIALDDGSIKCTITVGGGGTSLGDNPNTMGGTSAPTL